MADKELWGIAFDAWCVDTVDAKTDWSRVAAAVVAAHEARSGTAELVEQLTTTLDTIKHLSAMCGENSGDSAVTGVALLGLQQIAAWKEAQHG